jgi:chromosome segregation ATPase
MKEVQTAINSIKNNKFAVPIILISVVIILSLFVSFKATGFSVYSNKLDECELGFNICEEKAEALKTAVAKITTDLEVSKDEVSEKTDTITDLKQDISYLHAEQYDTVEKYNELVEKFDLIVDNSATSICCTMRFLESDGNTINSFNIEDNAIKCTTGGTFPLDCPNI